MAPRLTVAVLLILFLPAFVQAEETFVSIHKVIGNRMSIPKPRRGIGRGGVVDRPRRPRPDKRVVEGEAAGGLLVAARVPLSRSS